MTSTGSFTFNTATSTASPTATCITITPDKNGYVPATACNPSNFNYDPSFGAAIAFSILFGLTTFFHFYQAGIYKKWKLCWPMLMGALWELVSFALRSAATRNQQSSALQFVSTLLILLAPMWINAFVYMVLGRMIYFFIPAKKVWGIKGIKIAKIFVWLDVLSFLTQVGGGSMIDSHNSATTQMLGIHIYMGGIGFQQFCILLFTALAVKFFFIMRTSEISPSNQILDNTRRGWKKLLIVLFITLALITMRIIFRLIEFASGLDPDKNPIPYHEVYFYVLDAAPMLVALIFLNFVHPGHVLVGDGSEFPKGPTRKEKKAAKKAKKEEKMMKKERKKRGYGNISEDSGVEMV